MIFDPTKEVPTLNLCKKLKILGFPQGDTGWFWVKLRGDINYDLLCIQEEDIRWRRNYVLIGGCDCCAEAVDIEDMVKAPTANELLKALPKKLDITGFPDTKGRIVWRVVCEGIEVKRKNLACALSKLFIQLVMKGYITTNKPWTTCLLM